MDKILFETKQKLYLCDKWIIVSSMIGTQKIWRKKNIMRTKFILSAKTEAWSR